MNCLIIGFGHYATHEYIKLINRNKVALTHVVDLIPCESRIRAALKKSGIHEVSFLGMTPKKGKSTFILSKTESKQLDDFIKGRSIDFVIISTDPISHFAYCKWALENRLNILLDKPAVLRRNVSINLKAAKGIYSDFVELSELYRKARLQNNSLEFVISAQRRFSPAMKYIEEEMGHQEWILNDLAACGVDKNEVRYGQPAPATELMVAYAFDAIARKNPLYFFGMVFVLEGTSIALADAAAKQIKDKLSLPKSAFKYLTSHGALDQEHIVFFEGLMNKIVAPQEQAMIIHSANMFYRLYGDIFRELTPEHGLHPVAQTA